MSYKLHVPPDRSKTDVCRCTLADASLNLETAQELSRVLDECTHASQQQLNCNAKTSGVKQVILHYTVRSVHGVAHPSFCT